ncbi:hypothetical protein QYF61_011381, partial [Mycteria americana]
MLRDLRLFSPEKGQLGEDLIHMYEYPMGGCKRERARLFQWCPVTGHEAIPLQGLLAPKRVNSTSHFGIISKLANGAFNSCIQTIESDR